MMIILSQYFPFKFFFFFDAFVIQEIKAKAVLY